MWCCLRPFGAIFFFIIFFWILPLNIQCALLFVFFFFISFVCTNHTFFSHSWVKCQYGPNIYHFNFKIGISFEVQYVDLFAVDSLLWSQLLLFLETINENWIQNVNTDVQTAKTKSHSKLTSWWLLSRQQPNQRAPGNSYAWSGLLILESVHCALVCAHGYIALQRAYITHR